VKFINHEDLIKSPAKKYKASQRVRKTAYQENILLKSFKLNPFPTKSDRAQLSEYLSLDERKVQIWFQNKRQKSKE
ncbi:Homeodomain-like protein, partial [Neoconidiobolus thromboides FSU 785]